MSKSTIFMVVAFICSDIFIRHVCTKEVLDDRSFYKTAKRKSLPATKANSIL